ncbi:MAG TPA: HNH endonuclease [Rudaea sp.]|nr:HNH endonuclease [Rudaea sp.]
MNAQLVPIEQAMRPIPGYEGIYSVTADGRVWRHARTWQTGGKGNIERHHPGAWSRLNTERRYITFSACKDGKKVSILVHRAVAEAWIPNPLRLPQVNHKNSNRHDNRTGNLEWVTAEANTRHFHDSGRWNPTPKFLDAVCKNAVIARAAKRAKGVRA